MKKTVLIFILSLIVIVNSIMLVGLGLLAYSNISLRSELSKNKEKASRYDEYNAILAQNGESIEEKLKLNNINKDKIIVFFEAGTGTELIDKCVDELSSTEYATLIEFISSDEASKEYYIYLNSKEPSIDLTEVVLPANAKFGYNNLEKFREVVDDKADECRIIRADTIM